MPYFGERDGVKFTVEQRQAIREQVWQMYNAGLTQASIAATFGVSQPTVFYWLQKVRLEQARQARSGK